MQYLIYINKIGIDYADNYLYDFIFSDNVKGIDGEDWDTCPASGRPKPPNSIYIKRVGRLESELKFDVIQNSDTFAVWDAMDGVIALAWENLDEYTVYPDKRLCFKFGMTMDAVEGLLYEKDLALKYEK
jgi:hypothetical protein